MSLFRRFIFVSLICASPVFADWTLYVKHEHISVITIERNAVTVFWKGTHGFLSGSFGRRINERLPLQFCFISGEHVDHDAIDHHNVRNPHGRIADHTHLAFANMNHVHPDILNQVLIAVEFEHAERTRIMNDYLPFFWQNAAVGAGLLPLGTDPRPQHTPRLEHGVMPTDLMTNMVPRALIVIMMVYFALHLGGYYSNAL